MNGVAETARALRLNPGKLAKLAEGRAEDVLRSVAETAGFVELGSLGLGGPREPRTVTIELVGREGDRVRVEVVGGAVELVARARAVWSRGT